MDFQTQKKPRLFINISITSSQENIVREVLRDTERKLAVMEEMVVQNLFNGARLFTLLIVYIIINFLRTSIISKA